MKSLVRRVTAVFLAVLLLAASLHLGGLTLLRDSPVVDDPNDSTDMRLIGSADAIGVVGAFVVGAGAGIVVAHITNDGDVAAGEEATQQKIDLYQSALSSRESASQLLTTFDDNLGATDTTIKMEAANVLYNAYFNNASKSEAIDRVHQEIDNRTTIRQMNLINAWNQEVLQVEYTLQFAENSSITNVNSRTLEISSSNTVMQDFSGFIHPNIDENTLIDTGDDFQYVVGSETTNVSIQLANGTSYDVLGMSSSMSGDARNLTFFNRQITYIEFPDTYYANYDGFVVERPSGDLADQYLGNDTTDVVLADPAEYRSLWNRIESQRTHAEVSITDLADQLYSNGTDLSREDVVTPYFADHIYGTDSPMAYRWSLYSQHGLGAPAFDDLGNMTISANGTNTTGVILSDGLPANQTFEVGETYDPSNLTGEQMVLTQDGSVRTLTDPFTLSSAYSPNGTAKESVAYDDRGLNVSSTSQYEQSIQELLAMRAESQAREESKESAAGGIPNPASWFMGLNQVWQIIVVAAVLLLFLGAVK